jgi:hypothetical protein
MNGSAVLCSNCFTPLPPSTCNTGHLSPCVACNAQIQAEVFPANFRALAAGRTGDRIVVEGESSCFYHESKKAVVPCAACGRFLCAVCDVELDGQHLCPPCLETGRVRGTLQQLETKRFLYDNSALLIAIAPILLLYLLTFVTAPIAIFLAVLSFFKPNSIVGHSRVKAIAAIFIGLLQLAVWTLVFMGVSFGLNN